MKNQFDGQLLPETIQTTMSSREIAELTGKEHRHILRDCDLLNENYERLALPKIGQGYYTHPNTGNQQHRECLLTRIQTFDLMTGYNTELRIKVNRRWEELELKSRNANSIDLTDPNSILIIVQNWKEDYDKRIKAEHDLQVTSEKLDQANNRIAIDAPKVEFTDRIISTDGELEFKKVAKVLQLPFGRNILFAKLRHDGILMRNNEPYQSYIDLGYFNYKYKYIDVVSKGTGITFKKQIYITLVTNKGLFWLSKKYEGKNPKYRSGVPVSAVLF